VSVFGRLQVPSLLQQTQKFYIDWDLKLSDVVARSDVPRTNAVDEHGSGVPAERGEENMQDWVSLSASSVETLRALALGTPRAIVSVLRDKSLIEEETNVFVVVKEGSRRVAAAGGNGDYKISFHFVFQLFVTYTQFREIYESIAHFIVHTQAGSDLAVALCMDDDLAATPHPPENRGGHGSGSSEGAAEAAKRRMFARILSCGVQEIDPFDSLIGVDWHPRQNAYQGLACLGSRKSSSDPGSRVLGMMRVGSAMANDHEWMQGYVEHAHPLAILADASISMPAPRCIPLRGFGAGQEKGVATDLGGIERGVIDSSLSAALRRVSEAGSVSTSHGGGGSGPFRNPGGIFQVSSSSARHGSFAASAGGISARDATSRACAGMEQILGAMPAWFKECIAMASLLKTGEDSGRCFAPGEVDACVAREFATANTSMECLARIGKPQCLAGRKPLMVHVQGTDICMCTLSMMQVPFKVSMAHVHVQVRHEASLVACACVPVRVCLCALAHICDCATHIYIISCSVCRVTKRIPEMVWSTASSRTVFLCRASKKNAVGRFVLTELRFFRWHAFWKNVFFASMAEAGSHMMPSCKDFSQRHSATRLNASIASSDSAWMLDTPLICRTRAP
jgi:hypothetical protein